MMISSMSSLASPLPSERLLNLIELSSMVEKFLLHILKQINADFMWSKLYIENSLFPIFDYGMTWLLIISSNKQFFTRFVNLIRTQHEISGLGLRGLIYLIKWVGLKLTYIN
jgi:hypothetical protein